MASYEELHDLVTKESALRNKVRVATLVAAIGVNTEPAATANHANRLLWAKDVFLSPGAKGDEVFPAVLATNRTATVAQITGAADAAIQAAVDTVVDLFANGV